MIKIKQNVDKEKAIKKYIYYFNLLLQKHFFLNWDAQKLL